MRKVREFTKDEVVGIEAKHITYVTNQNGKSNDLHVVKEIVHLKDKTLVPRLRFVEDYQRPYYITEKGQQNHKEKKDYEYLNKLRKYTSTQINLAKSIANVTKHFGRPYLKELGRSPYLYGSDVSSSSLLKSDYKKSFPDVSSPNTVAGGDIETNVYSSEREGEIICMSVTHKTNVFLAYLKDWVSDIDDPIQATLDELESIPELAKMKRVRNLDIQVVVVDSPVDIIKQCIGKLHEWKPDFFSFWNMNFDMSTILATLEHYGVDPKYIFSDPSVPNNYKYFHYKEDKPLNISAGGVSKSKSPAEQWHWITTPASFQCIDAMSTYRLVRLAGGKDSSYALDYILEKELSIDVDAEINTEKDFSKLMSNLERKLKDAPESYPEFFISDPKEDIVSLVEVPIIELIDDELVEIGVETVEEIEPVWHTSDSLTFENTVGLRGRIKVDFGKLKFAETDHLTGIEWHKEMQLNHKIRYGLYNIIDSIRLEQLDEKTDDLARSVGLYSGFSDYKNFNSNPKKLCDSLHYWYLDQPEPKVIASSSDQMVSELDQFVVGHQGWINGYKD